MKWVQFLPNEELHPFVFCVSAHNAKSHYADASVEYQSSLRRVNRVLRTIASFPRLLRTGSA